MEKEISAIRRVNGVLKDLSYAQKMRVLRFVQDAVSEAAQNVPFPRGLGYIDQPPIGGSLGPTLFAVKQDG